MNAPTLPPRRPRPGDELTPLEAIASVVFAFALFLFCGAGLVFAVVLAVRCAWTLGGGQ